MPADDRKPDDTSGPDWSALRRPPQPPRPGKSIPEPSASTSAGPPPRDLPPHQDEQPEPLEVAGPNARANVKRPPPAKGPRRSPGYVRSASKALRKEAAKILSRERQRSRIPPKIVAQIESAAANIERMLAAERVDIAALEREAELLDELLHEHASFARKSALRETLENIGIAIGVALAVRSCVYEPFKIPSGSMMPTLRVGDHIFVNKFASGIQIPMTTTVIGQDWLRPIERGDVIVFRYPLDEQDDFIKRVIGLPGDTLRVSGDRRKIELRPAGEDEFVEITRERQHEQKCLAENSAEPIDNCSVYLETLDGKTYEVRYRDDLRSTDPTLRTYVVPDDHLLVMGDNRNASHDSLAWQVTEDAVAAEGLLSRIDVRDLTGTDGHIEVREGFDETTGNSDSRRDRVRYLAERPSVQHGLVLEAWRDTPIDQSATFEAIALSRGATEVIGFETLLDDAKSIGPRERERMLEVGAKIGDLYRGQDPSGYALVFRSPDSSVVFSIQCGRGRCFQWADLATKVVRVIDSWQENPDYDARELLVREPGRVESQPGRGNVEERFVERKFGGEGTGVRLRAWRDPKESLTVLRDAALGELGAGPIGKRRHTTQGLPEREAEEIADIAEWPGGTDIEGFVITLAEQSWATIVVDETRGMLAVLECGRKRCKTEQDAIELTKLVAGRFAELASEGERFPELLGQADVGALPEVPVEPMRSYYWDHAEYEGRVLDDSHSLTIEVEMDPPEGLDAALREAKDELTGEPQPAEALGPGAFYAAGAGGHEFVFAVPETKLVVQLSCRPGLCQDRQAAEDLAKRAREKGRDPENFLQKDVTRPKPFVPRGHVKGRAEVIWWPTSRFWKKIE